MTNKICKTCSVALASNKGTYCSKVCHHKDQGNISKAITAQKQEAAIQAYNDNPISCGHCSKTLQFQQRHNKFCSRQCSAIHSNTTRPRSVSKEFVERQRARALANPTGWAKSKIGGKPNRAPREIRVCKTCKNPFEILKSNTRVSCSKSCARTSGAREGSGRAKTGYYKGIYCGSTYELAFLIYHLDKGNPIQRCGKSFSYNWEDQNHIYYPDFEINGIIYEIKGRMQPVDLVKIASCNATLIYKDDIKMYLDYVSKTYGAPKDKLWILYDLKRYKNCKQCEEQFIPKSKKGIYCSRSCGLKANRLLSPRFICR